jgi:glycosyltransferase involved in cell wall biosynthesis
MEKFLFLFRYAPLYRQAIYELLDKELNCRFVFNSSVNVPLKMMDTSSLRDCNLCGAEKELFAGLVYIPNLKKQNIYDSDIIVMATNPRNLTFWRVAISRKLFHRNIRIIGWGHGAYGRENWIKKIIKKAMFSLCDYILLYGNYAKNLIIKSHLASEFKLRIIYNSLDYDTQLSIRNKLAAESQRENIFHEHFGNRNPVLIFLGRLTKRKQLYLAVEAIKRLNNGEEFPVNLVLIGKGETEKELKELAVIYNLTDKVWFYGDCYDEDINGRLLYDADICISPGDVGLTAIHAFTFGCPVITHRQFQTQVPEFEIVEPKISGMFFEKNSIDDLVEKVKYFLLYEKNNREAVRQACYRQVDEKYNPYYQLSVIKSLLK